MSDKNGERPPESIEEAVDILRKELSMDALQQLAAMETDEVEGETHSSGLGLYVRNRWLHHRDCRLTLNDVPDIVSARIVRSLWDRVRKEGLPEKTPGDAMLIEDSKDPFWGKGLDGQGANKLGALLMEVRDVLRGETNP